KYSPQKQQMKQLRIPISERKKEQESDVNENRKFKPLQHMHPSRRLIDKACSAHIHIENSDADEHASNQCPFRNADLPIFHDKKSDDEPSDDDAKDIIHLSGNKPVEPIPS